MKILEYFVYFLLSVMAAFLLSFAASYIYLFFRGYRLPKRVKYQKPSILKRVFIDFPYRLLKDVFNRDPDAFNVYGVHLFCGEQGSGKTVSVVHYLMELKKRFAKSKVRTNFCYDGQDGEITTWQQLIQNENGIYGQIEVIDEIQTWFSSLQSKDFPPEMLMEISQERKQRKMLIGTAQVFGRVAKPIREQVTYVYCPMTLFGCLTIVRVSKPKYYDEENFRFKRYIRRYFFVHNDEIRNSFDTYKKIQGLAKSGFAQRIDFVKNQ